MRALLLALLLLLCAPPARAGAPPKAAGRRAVTLLDGRTTQVEHPVLRIIRHPSLPFAVVLQDESGRADPQARTFAGPAALVDLQTGAMRSFFFDFGVRPDRLWSPDGTWLEVGGDTFKGLSLVPRDRLGAYAAGDDTVVRRVVLAEEQRTAKQHAVSRWLGPDALVLGAACCGCVIFQQVSLAPGGQATDLGMVCGATGIRVGARFDAPQQLVLTVGDHDVPVEVRVQTVHAFEREPASPWLLLHYSAPDGHDRALLVDPKDGRHRDLGVLPEQRRSPTGAWFVFSRDDAQGLDVVATGKLGAFLAGDDTVVRHIEAPGQPPGSGRVRWDVVRWVSKDELEVVRIERPHRTTFRANAATGRVVEVGK